MRPVGPASCVAPSRSCVIFLRLPRPPASTRSSSSPTTWESSTRCPSCASSWPARPSNSSAGAFAVLLGPGFDVLGGGPDLRRREALKHRREPRELRRGRRRTGLEPGGLELGRVGAERGGKGLDVAPWIAEGAALAALDDVGAPAAGAYRPALSSSFGTAVRDQCEQFFVDANEDDDETTKTTKMTKSRSNQEDELVVDPPVLDVAVTDVVAVTEVVAGLPDLLLPPQPAAATASTRIEANADVYLMPALPCRTSD